MPHGVGDAGSIESGERNRQTFTKKDTLVETVSEFYDSAEVAQDLLLLLA